MPDVASPDEELTPRDLLFSCSINFVAGKKQTPDVVSVVVRSRDLGDLSDLVDEPVQG